MADDMMVCNNGTDDGFLPVFSNLHTKLDQIARDWQWSKESKITKICTTIFGHPAL
jgi:hypothetical protein